MAQRWESDFEDDLQAVDLNLAIGTYGQNGIYEDTQPRIDEATLLAVQQQMAQQAAFSVLPDEVKRFVVRFHQAVLDNNLAEITVAYESGWNKLTEKYYAKIEWPEAEVIAPLVNDDSEGPVTLELPEQWLWDIIDEFIYQFQSFCVWRSKVKSKSEEELGLLADAGQVWSSYSVLNVLYSLIQKSRIHEHMAALQEGKSPAEISELVGEYGVRPLYRMLGYFSIIGLLRVHSLLGDFTLALKVMEGVELNQKSPFTRVTACHVTTYYYVGFCYIMLRRYPDAIRTFVSILNFILRMRQYHTRSYQYDQINKTADRMYALYAICNALSPSRLDDNISNIVKERYGEQFSKMSKGSEEGIPAFEELFLYACPKFINANPPPYDDPELLSIYLNDLPTEPAQRHLSLFLSEVRAQAPVPTLRSFLKLYTSLDATKLASFLDADEEEMVQQLMVMKQASRSVSRVENEKGLLDGQTMPTSDLDFVIDENMVHIAESTVGRRYAGWFIRNTEHAQRVFDTVKNSPLPPKSGSAQTQHQPSHREREGGGGGGERGERGERGGDRANASGGQKNAGHNKVAWGGVKVN
ncbi:hypothetical protein EUX98_g8158 [Antrodiella citrinella]|uniref:Eukaryotic translation initiation factor 3 subunit L n=1 Tax=Antrodiella citrinella TaxID=2447956 RepID=A0A4S4MAR1_9APHY|nr:hypothetical protein EUX98_g8158 [Antrodiella citrinella]